MTERYIYAIALIAVVLAVGGAMLWRVRRTTNHHRRSSRIHISMDDRPE